MLLEIALLLFTGAAWLFLGFQMVRFFAPRAGIVIFFSLGAMLGESLYLLFVNIGSYIFQIHNASWISLTLFFIGGFFFYYHNKKNAPPLEIKMRMPNALTLVIASAFIIALYTIVLFFGEKATFDPDFHYPLAATFAEGNFPPRLPSNPDYSVQYHYGIDLLAGSLISVADTLPWNAFNVLVIWNLFWAFILAFALGRILGGNNFASGFWAAILLFFGSSFNYISDMLGGVPMNSLSFISAMAPSYGLQLFHLPTSFAVPVLLATLCVTYLMLSVERRSANQFGLATIFIITLSALALSSEENFVLYIFGLVSAGVLFFFNVQPQRRPLMIILGALTLAAVLVSFQGGMLTDSIMGGTHALQTDTAKAQFQLRESPGFIFWENADRGFLPFSNPQWIAFLFEQMGPLPFLFPFILFLLWKKIRDKKRIFIITVMAIMAFASFLIPSFIEYTTSDVNFIRVYLLSKNLGNILLGAGIGILLVFLKKNIALNKFVLIPGSFVLLAYAFAPIAYHGMLMQNPNNGWGWNALPVSIQSQDVFIGKEIKQLTAPKSRILTNNYTTLASTSGRFVPFALESNVYEFNPVFIRLFPEPSVEDLRRLGITNVYVAPFQQNNHHGSPEEFLDQGISAQYLQEHSEWFLLIKKWEFESQYYYLYKVL